MERINKIRAWSPTENKMYYADDNDFVMCSDGSLLRMHHGRDITDEGYRRVDTDKDLDWIPMFFVGCTDKKGNEIYGEDLIKGQNIYRVFYDESCFEWMIQDVMKPNVRFRLKDLIDVHAIEKVGNAYENPELMK